MRRFRLVFSTPIAKIGVRWIALEVRTQDRARELAERMLKEAADNLAVDVWEGETRLFTLSRPQRAAA